MTTRMQGTRPLAIALVFGLTVMVADAQPPQARPREATVREYQVQTEPPGPDRVFRLESEAAVRERIRQEFRDRHEIAEFPKDVAVTPPVNGEAAVGRSWAPAVVAKVPHVVCHRPLYFEDKNVERYAWDFPVLQPIFSLGKFYCDLVTLPYQMGVQAPWDCDCQTDYDMPLQPIPYYVYVPPFSWKGAALQTGTVLGGIAIFP